VFKYYGSDPRECEQAEMAAAGEFRNIPGNGEMMTLVIMENFARRGIGVAPTSRAQADLDRLQCYVRAADAQKLPDLRRFVVQQAKEAMNYHKTGEYPVWFCLMAADNSVALGNFDDAEKLYLKVTGTKMHSWRGYLGHGGISERREKYADAVQDYETAFYRSQSWWDGYACATKLTDLCFRSGKLAGTDPDKRQAMDARADKLVRTLMQRTTTQEQRDSTMKLLDRKKPSTP
jgi:hypothetical protein